MVVFPAIFHVFWGREEGTYLHPFRWLPCKRCFRSMGLLGPSSQTIHILYNYRASIVKTAAMSSDLLLARYPLSSTFIHIYIDRISGIANWQKVLGSHLSFFFLILRSQVLSIWDGRGAHSEVERSCSTDFLFLFFWKPEENEVGDWQMHCCCICNNADAITSCYIEERTEH